MIALTQQSNSIDEVIHGEALVVLRTLPDNSVDAIVCDPPGNLKFMGKKWDDYGSRDAFIKALTLIMAEALRVLKPGGHTFVWALPRTSHWTGMALEDAGFEVRDCINHLYDASTLMQQFLASLTPSQSDAFKALMDSQSAPSLVSHIFGSGFPKSLDISKAIDKMQGAKREVIGQRMRLGDKASYETKGSSIFAGSETGSITAPATPEAAQWDGWGTALKPASEHWYLVRKPLSEKSIAANVLKWGTGAINIDASRIGTEQRINPGMTNFGVLHDDAWKPMSKQDNAKTVSGRWPANLLLSHSVFCVPNGVKKVRGNGGVRPDTISFSKSSNTVAYDMGEKAVFGYNDSEGMEQVEDWLCDESCPVRLLDEQSGVRAPGYRKNPSTNNTTWFGATDGSHIEGERGYNDQGGASRYFQRFYYVSKASRAERNRGCEGLPEREHRNYGNGKGIGRIYNRCPEHNGSLPSGTNYYTCGCKTVFMSTTEYEYSYKLRDDLTPEQRAYVEQELAKIGGES